MATYPPLSCGVEYLCFVPLHEDRWEARNSRNCNCNCNSCSQGLRRLSLCPPVCRQSQLLPSSFGGKGVGKTERQKMCPLWQKFPRFSSHVLHTLCECVNIIKPIWYSWRMVRFCFPLSVFVLKELSSFVATLFSICSHLFRVVSSNFFQGVLEW